MSRSSIFKTNGVIASSGGGSALDNGLQCYYNFEGNGNDATSNARNLGGTYQQVTGKVGQYAAGFTGGYQGLYFNTDLWDIYASPQDFSASFWFNPSQIVAAAFFGAVFSAMGFWIQLNSNGTIFSNIWSSGLANVTSTTILNIGTWYHVTVVHNSIAKTLKLYINGNLEATGTYTGFSGLPPQYNNYRGFAVDGSALSSGSEYGMACKFDAVGLWNRQLTTNEISYLYNSGNGQAYPFVGGGGTISKLSKILIKGYNAGGSGNPFTANANTSLLLHMDGSNGSTSFVDSSNNNFTVTNNGTPTISNTQKKWGTGSGYFNGSSFLTIPDNAVFNLSNTPFTIEAWFYAETLPNNIYTNSAAIISKDTYGSNFSWNINVANNGIVFVTSQANDILYFLTTINTNQWYHIALAYNGTTLSVYLDGVLVSTPQSVSVTNSPANITVGCLSWNNPNTFFTGYIDELRVLKGVAAYPGPEPSANTTPISTFKIITKGYVKPTPSIVTSGLILLLDASEVSSYSGTGAVWNDISGNNNNFAINPAAFNSGGKYMDFKGSYGCAKSPADITLSGDVTYLCVTRIRNSTSNWRTLTRSYVNDHHVIVQNGGWNIGMYDNDTNQFISSGYSQQYLPGYASNSFDVMCWRWTNSDNPTYSFNVGGNNVSSITNSNARYNRGFGSIGAYHNGNVGNPNSADQYWGDIKLFAVYNRRLSDQEVTQNYNALVAKFGL